MGSQADGAGKRRVKALEKGLRIVEELKEQGSAGVSELASELNMPTSTVHVYLQTLKGTGYVVGNDGTYQLSLRFLEIGSKVRDQREVFAAARQEMIDICHSTGETVGLGVLEDGKRVQLWQIEGKNAINDNIHIGEYTHTHWTSLGKTLLASQSDESIEEIVERHGLPRATENTITDKHALFDEVETIRAQGYTLEDEERKMGIRSVSVPLTDSDGNTIAALGITAPKNKMTSATCGNYIAQLNDKANVISIKYAYQ
ncbi:IclR family transcriptional regulator [Natrarchaeobius halalkaliphilus]|uniref:IclR family transcriptional regulator n=1 Tax=Natrarchaeobius halalkaliphilus TaxID=1679091 RepID=A0A3N6NVG1_9EURY|nr:IclR family transcriptional regulator [Natrarchaeobius halalkaliphilus]RQG87812.1 IclR family transcriptional regulator [Natrarchaeobius halalkaliphilus]